MAKLFIPAIGDRITLAQPWQFNMYMEHRNIELAKILGYAPPDTRWSIYMPNTRQLAVTVHTMDAGTILECDRIYIKATSKRAQTLEDNYDSISWKIVLNGKTPRSHRFWAKLHDCHSMEFDPASISTYRDRK